MACSRIGFGRGIQFYKSIDVYCCMISAWAIVKENIVIHMNGVFFNFSGVNSYSFVNRCPFLPSLLPSFIHCPSFIHYFSMNITMIFYSRGQQKKEERRLFYHVQWFIRTLLPPWRHLVKQKLSHKVSKYNVEFLLKYRVILTDRSLCNHCP